MSYSWILFAAVALVFWGVSGVTQKLATNRISSELSFLWFAYAMMAISLVLMATATLNWHVQSRIFWLAVAGGTLNGLGALTSFKALESGGKASVVIALIALFPLVTVAAHCDANGARTLSLSQRRFLADGAEPGASRWSVPLQVRSDVDARPVSVLLTRDGQTEAAGRCDAPLSVNADAVGYYRAAYDAQTLATTTRYFARLRSGDRIALLDDQWALVQSGAAPLSGYLALAGAMGDNLESRSWTQISDALEATEKALRGSPRHDAFAAYARGILHTPFAKLGWTPAPGETPDRRRLRSIVIEDLGTWGDEAVLAGARTRFEAFTHDHKAISPDEQGMILRIVARNADAATFDALHAVARSAKGEAELNRYFGALMNVRDPALAARAVDIALSAEVPIEADAQRMNLIAAIADANPGPSWEALRRNYDRLMAPQANFAALATAEYLPQIYSRGIPLAEIETFVRSKVPAEMAQELAHGLEAARLRVAHEALLRQQAEALAL